MKKAYLLLLLWLSSTLCQGQTGEVIEHLATKFTLQTGTETIEFLVVDTVLNQRKPVFLWCQGSLPYPLFCEVENYGYYFFGGGVSNFDYKAIAKDYHLVIISMPATPVLARKENLNSGFQYVPDPGKPQEFSAEFIAADHLEAYVHRALSVLRFLKSQSWVDKRKLVVAGHSQGTKVATKIALRNKQVSHLGLFAANPFGRADQLIREARLDAQTGKISWQQADSLMNDNYAFYETAHHPDSVRAHPELRAWQSFSETFYDDWLALDIPIYLAYGTEDRTSDLCDLVPLFFTEKHKNNLTLKRYTGLEHNFFEVSADGRANHEKGHWKSVMEAFVGWIE